MLISNIYLSGKGIALGKRNNKKFISSKCKWDQQKFNAVRAKSSREM